MLAAPSEPFMSDWNPGGAQEAAWGTSPSPWSTWGSGLGPGYGSDVQYAGAASALNMYPGSSSSFQHNDSAGLGPFSANLPSYDVGRVHSSQGNEAGNLDDVDEQEMIGRMLSLISGPDGVEDQHQHQHQQHQQVPPIDSGALAAATAAAMSFQGDQQEAPPLLPPPQPTARQATIEHLAGVPPLGSARHPGDGVGGTDHPFNEHPSRTLYVRNVSPSCSEAELRQLFGQCGDVQSLYTACLARGFVMVSYHDIRAARSAMRHMQGRVLWRRRLDVHFSIPRECPAVKGLNQGTLVVFNLDASVTNEELKVVFSRHGEVKEIRETPHKQHHKFVEFFDVRHAAAALRALNRTEIAGKRVKIEPSRPGGARRSLMQELTAELGREERAIALEQQQQQQQGVAGAPPPAHHRHLSGSTAGPQPQPHHHHNPALPAETDGAVATPAPYFCSDAGKRPVPSHNLHGSSSGGFFAPGPSGSSSPRSSASPTSSSDFLLSWGAAAAAGGGGGYFGGGDGYFGGGDGHRASSSPPGKLSASAQPWMSRASGGDGQGGGGGGGAQQAQQQLAPWQNPPPPPAAAAAAGSSAAGGGNQAALNAAALAALSVAQMSASEAAIAALAALAGAVNAGASTGTGGITNTQLAAALNQLQLNQGQQQGHVQGQVQGHGSEPGARGFSGGGRGGGGHAARGGMGGRGGHGHGHGHGHAASRHGGEGGGGGSGGSSDPHHHRAQQFALDPVRVLSGADTRTTLMVRNIPNKYTQKMLLAAIDAELKGAYDFFYLPIDFKNKCNVGYAFINLTSPAAILRLYHRFNNMRWERFNSEKVASITYARIQGKDALVSHFRNSSLMNEDKRCRPIFATK